MAVEKASWRNVFTHCVWFQNAPWGYRNCGDLWEQHYPRSHSSPKRQWHTYRMLLRHRWIQINVCKPDKISKGYENVQRPITLSRKNFLFRGDHEATVNMSVICSLLATCKAHDVNPRVYLNDVIAQMPYHKKATQEELLNLLPHKWKLKHPECVLTRQKEESCNWYKL